TALAVTAAAAPVGATNVASSASAAQGRPSAPARACLDNEGPAGGVGAWVSSENDTAAASDFRVGSKCVITVVTVGGYFFNGDGGDSFDVVVYRNDRSTGTPGKVIADRGSLAYTYDPDAALVTLHPDRITLSKGTYWIS